MENNEATEPENHVTITINRTLNLPLDTVWKAWTDPETFKKWWGPKDYTCEYCSIILKVGGNCVASMNRKDGYVMWSIDTYREIVPKNKLVCKDNFADSKGNIVSASYYKIPGDWSKELLLTVEFKEEAGGKTTMALTHEGIPESASDDCEKGWQSSFDKMDANL